MRSLEMPPLTTPAAARLCLNQPPTERGRGRNLMDMRGGKGERGGFFADSQSRADEVDNWAAKKSFFPSEPMRSERRGGFGLDSSNGGANSDNWLKSKEEEGLGSGGAFDSLRERRGVFDSNGADSGSWGKKREEGSCGGRPRLNLQPRTLPVMDLLQQREAFGVGMAERGRSTRPKMLGGNRNQWFLVPKGCILGLSQIK